MNNEIPSEQRDWRTMSKRENWNSDSHSQGSEPRSLALPIAIVSTPQYFPKSASLRSTYTTTQVTHHCTRLPLLEMHNVLVCMLSDRLRRRRCMKFPRLNHSPATFCKRYRRIFSLCWLKGLIISSFQCSVRESTYYLIRLSLMIINLKNEIIRSL